LWPLTAVLAAGLFSPSPALAATLAWTGATNTDWFTASNWSPTQVPTSADDAVIDANATVTAGVGSTVRFGTLALGDAGAAQSPTFKVSGGLQSSGSLTIYSGATFQQDSVQTFALGSLSVASGGTITHTPNSTSRAAVVNLSVTGDFSFAAGATITGDTKGYAGGGINQAGFGPGGGGTGSTNNGGGGGHGGWGAAGNGGSPGGAGYDDVANPTDLGSGGGGDTTHNGGSPGGGAVLLSVGGTLTLNGTISVNGAAGNGSGFFSDGGGAGAGGTINIRAANLAGSGTLSANGGAPSPYGGAAGGAGRISVTATSTDVSALHTQADPSLLAGATGGQGTIAVQEPGASARSLTIGNPSVSRQATTQIPGATLTFVGVTVSNANLAFDAGSAVNVTSISVIGAASISSGTLNFATGGVLEIRNGGQLLFGAAGTSGANVFVRNGSVFQQANVQQLSLASVEVDNGGQMTHAPNATAKSALLNLNVAGDFNLLAGGAILADGKGYSGGGINQAGYGPGGGGTGSTNNGGGGGHGGAGGAGAGGSPGGPTYDSLTNPTDLGSGSGGDSTHNGGSPGGGAVLIQVGGNFNLNGSISAKGAPGNGSGFFGDGGGGGSGGTVNLVAGSLAGAGTIDVSGGNGSPYGGAGGGGGRITLGGLSGLNLTNIAAGGSGNASGAAGTINFIPPGVTDNPNNLIVPAGTTYTLTGARSYNTAIRIDGTLYVKPYDGTTSSGTLSLSAPNVTISSAGLITADAAGYPGGRFCTPTTAGGGPGGGAAGSAGPPAAGPLGGGGGGHIGFGGNGLNAANGGAAYDSFLAPGSPGSGGGGGRDQGCNDGAGGAGGGVVSLSAANTLTLNGKVTADGLSGHAASGFNGDSGGGGGAGGAVVLSAANLAGNGTVHANGGAGASSAGIGGGGGSGGAVAVVVTGSNASSLSLSAGGGSSASGSAAGGAGVVASKVGVATVYDLAVGGSATSVQTSQAATPFHGSAPTFGAVAFNNCAPSFDNSSSANFSSLVIAGTATVNGSAIAWGGNAEIKPNAVLQLAAGSTQGGLQVDGGGLFRQLNTQQLSFTSVSLQPGSVMTHGPNGGASRAAVLNLNVSGDLTLSPGASILLDGSGYGGGNPQLAQTGQSPGFGPGGGGSGGNGSGAGGGHGGGGGNGDATGLGGVANDDTINPTDLGSGGAGAYSSAGSAGGGAAIIKVAGTLALNGLISANGSSTAPDSYYATGGGGGAGGTINLTAGTLTGTGTLRANGGNGSGYGGASGGGGRIAISISAADSSALSISANNGNIIGNGRGAPPLNGGAGTLAVQEPGGSGYNLTIGTTTLNPQAPTLITGASPSFAGVNLSNSIVAFGAAAAANFTTLTATGVVTMSAPGLTVGSFVLVGSMTLTTGGLTCGANPLEIRAGGLLSLAASAVSNCNLVVRNGGIFKQSNAFALNLLSIEVDSGGQLTHAPNGGSKTAFLNLNVSGNFNLQSGAAILVDGLGYSGRVGSQTGAGSGGGGTGGSRNGGGGGHGGAGAASSDGSQGGAIYDSAFFPEDLGSQGGGSTLGGGIGGGAGGGAIVLQVGGSCTLNGLVSANGIAGTPETYNGSGGGGGGGGTVNIGVATLSGAGMIRANGGGGTGYGGAGGGGGRIALSYGSKTGTLALLAAGGTTSSGNGSAGTVMDNNQLSGFSNASSTPTAGLTQMHESISAGQTLSETLAAQSLDFSGGTSTGVSPGTFSVAKMVLVTLQTGSFAGDGFFRGNWTLSFPSGDFLTGVWQGTAQLNAATRQMVLKGVIEGGIRGVLEGGLTESIPGSGNFDRLSVACSATQIGTQLGASSLYFTAGAPLPQTAQYPGTSLNLLQASLTGQTSGYLVGPLENTFTLVTVNSAGNPYNGEGFFFPTYSSSLGVGQGWAYANTSLSQVARLTGLYDYPLRSLFEGILITASPRSLLVTLERLDVGAAIQPILSVFTTYPHVATPGAIDSYSITIRNDGYAAATNQSIVAAFPEYADFVSATGSYRYYSAAHYLANAALYNLFSPEPFLRWDLAQIPPRSSVTLLYQAKFRPATLTGPQAHSYIKGGGIDLVSTSFANQMFIGYPIGGTH